MTKSKPSSALALKSKVFVMPKTKCSSANGMMSMILSRSGECSWLRRELKECPPVTLLPGSSDLDQSVSHVIRVQDCQGLRHLREEEPGQGLQQVSGGS